MNIDAQKQAELATRHAEEQFRLFVENVHEYALVQADPQGTITSWNPGAEHLFGHTAPEVIGQPLSKLVAEHPAKQHSIVKEVVFTGRGIQHEQEQWLTRKDGSRFWTRWVSEAIYDGDSEVRGVAMVMRDETERPESEEMVRRSLVDKEQLLKELERSNQELTQFSYVLSHDLVGPSQSVYALGELLLRDREGKLNEGQQRLIGMMTQTAAGMDRLVKSMLEYAQVGHGALKREAVPLTEVIDQVSARLAGVIGESTAAIHCGSLPTIEGDRTQMEQLFQITRFLSGQDFTSKDLWQHVKPVVRSVEASDGVLIFDDTIQEKAWTDENALMCWHYDHVRDRNVRGINLLNALYHANGTSIPVALELVKKPIQYCDLATRQLKRRSEVTKNELMREMIGDCIRNELKFRFVLMDSWFSATENFDFIVGKGRHFIAALKDNRPIAVTEDDRSNDRFVRVEDLNLPEQTVVRGWLKGYRREVLVLRQVFTNKDGSTGRLHLVSSDLTCGYDAITTTYKKRWQVEVFHKSISQWQWPHGTPVGQLYCIALWPAAVYPFAPETQFGLCGSRGQSYARRLDAHRSRISTAARTIPVGDLMR